jgi:hypothetical protein
MFVFMRFVSVICMSMWVYESDCNPYGECLWAGLVKIYVKQPILELFDEGRNGRELDTDNIRDWANPPL